MSEGCSPKCDVEGISVDVLSGLLRGEFNQLRKLTHKLATSVATSFSGNECFTYLESALFWLLCSQLPEDDFARRSQISPIIFDPKLFIQTKGAALSRVCGYSFKPGDLAFNCLECQFDATCVVCESCFKNSNHEGHDVRFVVLGDDEMQNGCCDCGDVEAWASEGCCPKHNTASVEDGICSLRVASQIVLEEVSLCIWSCVGTSYKIINHVPGCVPVDVIEKYSLGETPKHFNSVHDLWVDSVSEFSKKYYTPHTVGNESKPRLPNPDILRLDELQDDGSRLPLVGDSDSMCKESNINNDDITIPQFRLGLLQQMLESINLLVLGVPKAMLNEYLLRQFEKDVLAGHITNSVLRVKYLLVITKFVAQYYENKTEEYHFWTLCKSKQFKSGETFILPIQDLNTGSTMLDKSGVWLRLHINDNYSTVQAFGALRRRLAQPRRLEHFREKLRVLTARDVVEKNSSYPQVKKQNVVEECIPNSIASEAKDGLDDDNTTVDCSINWPNELIALILRGPKSVEETSKVSDSVILCHCSSVPCAIALRESLCGPDKKHLSDPELMISVIDFHQRSLEDTSVHLVHWLSDVCELHGGLCDELVSVLCRPRSTMTTEVNRIRPSMESIWRSTVISDVHESSEKKHSELNSIHKSGAHGVSLLHQLMMWYPYLRRDFRRNLHRLFLRLLSHKDFKMAFAISYTYSCAITQRVTNSGLGRTEESLCRLSVQFLNRPSFVNLLTQNEHAIFQKLLRSFDHALTLTLIPSSVTSCMGSSTCIDLQHPLLCQRRFGPIELDIKYCLHIAEAAVRFCENSEYLLYWFKLLACTQCMNIQQRQESMPLLYTSTLHEVDDYVQSFNLEISLSSTGALLFKWITELNEYTKLDPLNKKRILDVVDTALHALSNWLQSQREGNGCNNSSLIMECVKRFHGDCSKNIFSSGIFEEVSFHYPLHRGIAQLLRAISVIDGKTGMLVTLIVEKVVHFIDSVKDSTSLEVLDNTLALGLLKYPLTTLVLCAQCQAGMWKRSSLVQRMDCQTQNYILLPLMRDCDILLVQFSLLCLGPDCFMSRLLNQFGLLDWCEEESSSEIGKSYDVRLLPYCLKLIVIIVTELPRSSSGWNAELRREMIHRLASGPCTYSELECAFRETSASAVGAKAPAASVIESIVSSIAVTCNNTADQQPQLYELREECKSEFDPLHYHVASTLLEKARQRCFRKKGHPVVAPPPIVSPAFEKCRMLLFESKFLRLLVRGLDSPISSTSPVDEGEVLRVCTQLMTLQQHWIANLKLKIASYSSDNLSNEEYASDKGSLEYVLKAIQDSKLSEVIGNRLISQRSETSPIDCSSGYSSAENHLIWILRQMSDYDVYAENTLKKLDVVEKDVIERHKLMEARKSRAQHDALSLMAKQQAVFAEEFGISSSSESEESTDIEEESTNVDDSSGTLPVEHSYVSEKQQSDKLEKEIDMLHDIGRNETTGTSTMENNIASYGKKSNEVCAKKSRVVSESMCTECCICHEEVAKSVLVVPGFVQDSVTNNVAASIKCIDGDSFAHLRGIFVSQCGHVLHQHCWKKYFDAISSSPVSPVISNFDVEIGEFLCPVCKTLSNTLVPIVNNENRFKVSDGITSDKQGEDIALVNAVKDLVQNLSGAVRSIENDLSLECKSSSSDRNRSETITNVSDRCFPTLQNLAYTCGVISYTIAAIELDERSFIKASGIKDVSTDIGLKLNGCIRLRSSSSVRVEKQSIHLQRLVASLRFAVSKFATGIRSLSFLNFLSKLQRVQCGGQIVTSEDDIILELNFLLRTLFSIEYFSIKDVVKISLKKFLTKVGCNAVMRASSEICEKGVEYFSASNDNDLCVVGGNDSVAKECLNTILQFALRSLEKSPDSFAYPMHVGESIFAILTAVSTGSVVKNYSHIWTRLLACGAIPFQTFLECCKELLNYESYSRSRRRSNSFDKEKASLKARGRIRSYSNSYMDNKRVRIGPQLPLSHNLAVAETRIGPQLPPLHNLPVAETTLSPIVNTKSDEEFDISDIREAASLFATVISKLKESGKQNQPTPLITSSFDNKVDDEYTSLNIDSFPNLLGLDLLEAAVVAVTSFRSKNELRQIWTYICFARVVQILFNRIGCSSIPGNQNVPVNVSVDSKYHDCFHLWKLIKDSVNICSEEEKKSIKIMDTCNIEKEYNVLLTRYHIFCKRLKFLFSFAQFDNNSGVIGSMIPSLEELFALANTISCKRVVGTWVSCAWGFSSSAILSRGIRSDSSNKINSLKLSLMVAHRKICLLVRLDVAEDHLVRLIDLPDSYTDLHISLMKRSCAQHPSKRPKTPALCLICGAFLCAGSDCCRKDGKGACTTHALKCSGSSGIFLLIRQGMILLTRGTRSILVPSPYVDKHGESINGRNGRPLFLDQIRWEALRQLWGQNGIAKEVTAKRENAVHLVRASYY